MILGIIPARGGSKGVPGKNIRDIYGKPLIVWTIERALEAELINHIVVTTDSDRIATIAKDAGVEVLMRPSELATDTASTLDVMIHALGVYPADTVVLLQPTSPYRKKGRIDECIKDFITNNYDSLATGFICDYKEYGTNNLPRQMIDGFFYDDGSIYVIKAANILMGDRYGVVKKTVQTSREENVEIDDEFDFWMCEKILEKMDLEGLL